MIYKLSIKFCLSTVKVFYDLISSNMILHKIDVYLNFINKGNQLKDIAWRVKIDVGMVENFGVKHGFLGGGGCL